MADSFQVTYLLSLADGENVNDRVLALQLEQSAELPESVVASMGVSGVKGRIVQQSRPSPRQVLVTIAWPGQNHAGEITQFLNILFGNISLKRGIAILDIQWDALTPDLFKGPAWGIDRFRQDWDIPHRALSCTALKPMGYPTGKLAAIAHQFAEGGIDIIKDDHGLTNQEPAPFRKRVAACVQAMDKAAQNTGRRSRYFPNITTEPHLLRERYEMAAELGADGVLLAPMLTGLASMHYLAQLPVDLPIMAHPAFSGPFVAHHPSVHALKNNGAASEEASGIPGESLHGFEPGLFFGALWRALGADFVIYPNAGGRFSFSPDTCLSINKEALRQDIPFPRTFPTPGGGVRADRMPYWLQQYGKEITFLIGGNLYEDPAGIYHASRAFSESLR
ncbi:RuBisCO large subunit C-terminal-like domain-containing protein [Balneolales bacterium ANBcel1]|nr:RuBisCO large subunit C-terminal-like domain-containing protein [Balneolales bacterium ANBcel1]